MSEYIVLSDIHGNAPALDAVVEQEGEDAEYLILGDIMGLLAYPEEVVQTVRELSGTVLGGNHDRAIFHEGVGHVNSAKLSEFELAHTITSLSHEQIDWMQDRPFFKVLTRSGERICLCHAYPWPEKASGYEAGNAGVRKRDVASVASAVSNDYDWVMLGHTHEQYDLDASKWGHDVHFVNPGSLGYDHTYSTVDIETGNVTHKSVEVETDVKGHVQSLLPDDAPHTDRWF